MQAEILISYDIEIPMRDGVILRANLYRPSDDGVYPTILMRLPYQKNDFEAYWHNLNPLPLARAGYNVILQDCRGTGASDGIMDFDGECQANDGYDTIEWLAVQPWSTGKIGMYGLSYFGFTQLLAAQAQPPHLASVCPWQQSGLPKYSGGFTTGAIHLLWLLQRIQDRLYTRPSNFPPDKLETLRATVDRYVNSYATYMRYLPLAKNPAAFISDFPILRDYIDRVEKCDDPSTPAKEGRPIDFSKLKIPCFFLGGWYDETSKNGPIDNWNAIRALPGGEQLLKDCLLIMGPWNHGERLPPSVGIRSFGPNASRPCGHSISDTLIDWFNATLKGIPSGRPNVCYFLMGENVWHFATTWPPEGAKPRHLYLGVGKNDFILLNAPSEESGYAEYRYDPHNPVPSRAPGINAECQDFSSIEQRDDVLVFTGAPLATDLTVIGEVYAELYVSSSCPDTDFMCRLTEVDSAGRSVNITDGAVRASYNNTYNRTLLERGEIRKVTVIMGNTANRFKAGSCLRLEIASSCFPKFDINQNVADRIGSTDRIEIADNRVHYGGVYPSALILPVYDVLPKE